MHLSARICLTNLALFVEKIYIIYMDYTAILQTITLITSVLIILLVLLQERGATLGSGSASSSEINTTRRGLEKSMFNTTLVVSFIFVLSILGLLII